MVGWIKITEIKFKNVNECVIELKNKGYYVSPWIENIVTKYNYKFEKNNLPISLDRITVNDLGFKGPTELLDIYNKLESLGFKLVSPEIAIYSRLIYVDQPSGEWVRFATPLKSMIDTDGVPHLPKLGSALGKKFIETYWSYPKAIFHPHNDFIVQSK
tara:strand:+ start:368 stop:841 length:474 start_codon:yes stop_codon:yes gene_type:complete